MNDILITDPTTWHRLFTPDSTQYQSFSIDQFSGSFSYADIEETSEPIRFGSFFSNPAAPYGQSHFLPTIKRPIIIIANPAAGGGKGMRHASRFLKVITGQKYAITEGDIQSLMTRRDPAKRTGAIVDTIKKYSPNKPPFVLVFGGDGTVADVAEAVSQSSREGYKATIVPCTGGTAGDTRRDLGVPKKPAQLVKFLARSHPTEIDVMTASFNDGPKQIVIHSQGNGASGAFFLEVEKYRTKTGRSGMPVYIRGMLRSIPHTEAFYVSVNGGPLIAAGEVLTVNSTSMGGIGRIPLPPHGGRLHILPVNMKLPGPLKPLPGLVTIGDAFIRGAAFSLGNESVISPGAKLKFLPPSRMIDIVPGETTTLEFFDTKGNPRTVSSVLNGDPSSGTRKVILESSTEKIAVLASDDSGLRIRRGESTFRTIRGIARNGFVTSSDWFRKASFPVILGACEVYKDAADLSPKQRATLDTGILAGIFSTDIFSVWRFGTTPLIAELPLIVPTFELGSTSVKIVVDEIGNQTGIEELKAGQTANNLAGIAGGFAAIYGFIKLVGVEAWNATAASINTSMVKYVGGAGMAAEDVIINLIRRLGGMSIPFPLIILPPNYYEPLNPTQTPEII